VALELALEEAVDLSEGRLRNEDECELNTVSLKEPDGEFGTKAVSGRSDVMRL
jgi:hypothetical protein